MDWRERVNVLNRSWERIGSLRWRALDYEIEQTSVGYQARYLPTNQALGLHDHWSKARGACQHHTQGRL